MLFHPRTLAPLGLGLLLGSLGTYAVLHWRGAGRESDVGIYREVRDFARTNFVRDISDAELLDGALHGLASGLDDYSAYFDVDELTRVERETGGRYHGLGMVLKRPAREGRILYTLPGGPARAAGMRVGDRIESVDGEEFEVLGEARFRAKIATAEPTEVKLVVTGLDGQRRELVARTGSVVEPTVRHVEILDARRGIGYCAIQAFSHETANEFAEAFDHLMGRGMKSLVIDLRGNPGGVLVAAVGIARRFVREGTIVSTEGRGEPVVHEALAAQAVNAGLPLVLLVDEVSASASEVLAGCLQDHRAAVLVGRATFGKGMVQTIHRFPERGTAIKVTTSYYYTPAHRNLEHSVDATRTRGLEPDVFIDTTDDERALLRGWLAAASPPADSRAAIAAWEKAESLELLDARPPDRTLDAALALLAGERPAPHRVRTP